MMVAKEWFFQVLCAMNKLVAYESDENDSERRQSRSESQFEGFFGFRFIKLK